MSEIAKYLVERSGSYDWEPMGIFDTWDSANSWIVEEYNCKVKDYKSVEEMHEDLQVFIMEVPYFQSK